jgi:queuine tRNA-ribosyltransferase
MLDRGTGEVMHPIVGPLAEAQHLYVGPSRLHARLTAREAVSPDDPLVVFDVGLGAGSNAAAAWRLSEGLPAGARSVLLVSFDRTTEPLSLALRHEHAGAFGFDDASRRAGLALLQHGRHATERTEWRLRRGELLDTLLAASERADIVFWDPFSPRADPSLWSVAAFCAVFSRCRPGATLHTYSAATATRSALLLAGFAVGFGDAVQGRQTQTTVAALDAGDLEHPLDLRWLERLRRSSAPLPHDAPADAVEVIARCAQFAS